ncbi:MAG: hypothetical protein ACLT1A_09775 [Dysosmobacter sp.]
MNMLWFAKQAFLGNSSGAELDTAQVNFVTMPNTDRHPAGAAPITATKSYVTPSAP